MGMFDTVIFPVSLLPISDEDKEKLKDESFQPSQTPSISTLIRVQEKAMNGGSS